MFSGIIQAIGRVERTERREGDLRAQFLTGELQLEDVTAGDSIAVNGVCLTVAQIANGGFEADISTETLACTTLDILNEGSVVNLEKSLRLMDALNGHLVSGHVDAVGVVIEREQEARSHRFKLRVSERLSPYLCVKGSICVDGVSLTINWAENGDFEVNIVPHTMRQTIIDSYQIGSRVNVEVDMVARYLERLLKARQAEQDDQGQRE